MWYPLGLVLAILPLDATAPTCYCSSPCDTSHAVPYNECWESNVPDRNQNCTAICRDWAVGENWKTNATRTPSKTVSTQSSSSWSCQIPGALELVTGGKTHMTMVFFEKSFQQRPQPCGTSCAALGCHFYNASCPCQCSNCVKYHDCCDDWRTACGGGGEETCEEAVSEAISYAAAHDASEVAVRDVLTYVWGCGPACTSTAALVDVTSRLAQLKYGLMAHFEAKGMAVDKSLWGATAHIQTVW